MKYVPVLILLAGCTYPRPTPQRPLDRPALVGERQPPPKGRTNLVDNDPDLIRLRRLYLKSLGDDAVDALTDDHMVAAGLPRSRIPH